MDKLGAVSADDHIDPAKEIRAMIHEAHRRPPYSVMAPAILRHRSFNFTLPGEVAISDKDVVALVDRLVTSLPNREDLNVRVNDHLDSIPLDISTDKGAIAGVVAGWRFRIRIEIHAEYISVTYILDAFNPQLAPQGNDFHAAIEKLAHRDCSTEKDAIPVVNQLFDDVWAKVDRAMGTADLSYLGEMLADFRGLAIMPASMAPIPFGENEVQMPDGDTTRFRREQALDPALRDFIRNRTNLLATILDLKTTALEASRQSANVVMCGMLDGAAVYASNLGTDSGPASRSLRYFVAYHGPTANQLGRFLRRLHVQGEVRLAALIDLLRLRQANKLIGACSRDVDHYAESLRNGTGINNESFNRFNALQARIWRIGRECRGGLRHRVTQSRHYAQAFRERMEDLRIVRIEGWQPYDVFVRRNLYKSYDFISRIGDSYTALTQRLGYLSVLRQTQATTENTDQAKTLLEYAHSVGMAAFVYYVGLMLGVAAFYLMNHVPHLACDPKAKACISNVFHSEDTIKIAGWAFAVVLYILDMLIHRWWRRRQKGRPRRIPASH